MKTHLIALTILSLTTASSVWAQSPVDLGIPYQSPGLTKKAESKKKVKPSKVFRGPVLSTALPSTGAYANGLQLTGVSSSFSAPASFQRAPIPRSNRFRVNLNQSTPDSFVGIPRVTSRSIARVAVSRGLFAGVGSGAGF